VGAGGRHLHRRGCAGEVADHPGIPNPALCPDRYHDASVPSGGTATAAGAALFPWVAGMTYLLEARGLTRRFGGVVALDNLDLAVVPNEIIGLIGPNGSGKTKFFNVVRAISGPPGGPRTFARADITPPPSRAIYNAGVSRTFQRSRLSLPLS